MNSDDYNLLLDKLNEKFKKWKKVRKSRSVEMLMKDANEWDAKASRIWNMGEIKGHHLDNETSTARLTCLIFAQNYSRKITKELAQRQTQRLIEIEVSKIRKATTKKKTKKKKTQSSKGSNKSQ